MTEAIRLFTAGGTIDKVYFDAKSEFQVGDTVISAVLERSNLTVPVEITQLLRKDSLEMTDEDRQLIREHISAAQETRIILTHGTDTMVETARALAGIPGKTIVLVGAMQPARMHESDAQFNLGGAIMATQLASEGVYIAMNGCLFDPFKARKNVEENRFEFLN